MPQVVAGIVLAQPLQPVQHRSVRQDRLDPQAQVARIAIAQHIDPARIGGQHPAHAGRPLRGQCQRKPAPHGLRMGLGLGQRRPGLDHHRVLRRVDLSQRRHAVQRQDHRCRTFRHHLPAHQARPATPGHDADPRFRAGPHQCRHLFNPARTGNGGPNPLPAVARFGQIARLDIGQRAVRQAGGKSAQKGGVGGDQGHGSAYRSRGALQTVSSLRPVPTPEGSALTAGRSAPPQGCRFPPARPGRRRPFRPETPPARPRKTSASAPQSKTAGA